MSKPAYKKGLKLTKPDQYASFGLRLIAWVIDMAIVFIIARILMLFFFWRTEILFFVTLLFLSYSIGFFYFFLFETFTNGRTLGKLIFGLKTVLEEKFQPVSAKVNLINCLLKCHWLPGFFDFVIGVLYNYGEPEKRLRIMQNFSQTVVIKTR